MATPLLAGDVGGTNTRLALVTPDGKKVLRSEALPSRGFPTFEAAARRFLGGVRVKAAALGIAGPVVNGRCTATNLPWVLDEHALSRKLHIPRIVLMNDLIAAVHGAIHAPRAKLAPLWGEHLPSRKRGNVAILAAGTGLGEAALIWDSGRYVSLATEGGHCDLAPRNDLEMRLLAHLRRVLRKRVSYERVLSGPGIGNLYDFFINGEGLRETARNEKALRDAADRNAAITELGQSGNSRPAKRALELFVSLLGAEAGNLALKCLPTGGLYVSGGIAGRLLPQLQRGGFTASFLDKGRMSTLLRTIPVAVVLDSGVGLKGSARVAASLV